MTEEGYVEIGGGDYLCELCQRRFTSEDFLRHLSEEHNREEVEALRKLAELALRNEEEYEQLCWELLRKEYFLRLVEKKDE